MSRRQSTSFRTPPNAAAHALIMPRPQEAIAAKEPRKRLDFLKKRASARLFKQLSCC